MTVVHIFSPPPENKVPFDRQETKYSERRRQPSHGLRRNADEERTNAFLVMGVSREKATQFLVYLTQHI